MQLINRERSASFAMNHSVTIGTETYHILYRIYDQFSFETGYRFFMMYFYESSSNIAIVLFEVKSANLELHSVYLDCPGFECLFISMSTF